MDGIWINIQCTKIIIIKILTRKHIFKRTKFKKVKTLFKNL